MAWLLPPVPEVEHSAVRDSGRTIAVVTDPDLLTVKELPAAQDAAIRKVEPQVVDDVAPFAFVAAAGGEKGGVGLFTAL
jgi:hypothetical protein